MSHYQSIRSVYLQSSLSEVREGALLVVLVNTLFFALSAFVGAGLIFAGITGWCGLGLLLSRAPWNRA